jgi:hypothetical protein
MTVERLVPIPLALEGLPGEGASALRFRPADVSRFREVRLRGRLSPDPALWTGCGGASVALHVEVAYDLVEWEVLEGSPLATRVDEDFEVRLPVSARWFRFRWELGSVQGRMRVRHEAVGVLR